MQHSLPKYLKMREGSQRDKAVLMSHMGQKWRTRESNYEWKVAKDIFYKDVLKKKKCTKTKTVIISIVKWPRVSTEHLGRRYSHISLSTTFSGKHKEVLSVPAPCPFLWHIPHPKFICWNLSPLRVNPNASTSCSPLHKPACGFPQPSLLTSSLSP